ncbi:MAG: hypothetical protein RLY93_20795 [Sumerlaeia bacterium]
MLTTPLELTDENAAHVRRHLLILAGAIFAVRAALLLLAPESPLRTIPEPKGDEIGYLALTQHLAQSNFTSYRIPGDSVDQRRPPVVPVLAAPVAKLFGQGRVFWFLWTLFQQACLASALAIAAWAALRLGFAISPWLFGILAAFDMISFVFGVRFLSEAIYVLLFTLSYAVLVSALDRPQAWKRAAVAGLLLGLVVITRPIAQFFFLPALVLLLWRSPEKSLRRLLAPACFLMAFLLPIGAWLIRNQAVHGQPFLSEISKVNLYRYWAPGIEAARENRPFLEVQAEYDVRFQAAVTDVDVENAQLRQEFMMSEALPVIKSHPETIATFIVPGFYHVLLGRATSPLNELYAKPADRGVMGHLRAMEDPFHILLVWGEIAALLGTYLLAALSILRFLWNRDRRLPLLLFLLPIAYHLALSWGPEATARFRLPVMPWLLVLAAGALAGLGKKSPLR